MKSRLREFVEAQGITLVALQSAGDDWAIPNVPTGGKYVPRDEIAYVTSVVSDLETRLAIRRDAIAFAGFSAGGMLVSHVACKSALRLHAFIAIAGTVWAPEPDRCTQNKTPLVHFHGLNDKVVPLKGRPIANTHQGDVRRFLDVLASGRGPNSADDDLGLKACANADQIRQSNVFLCLNDNGHGYQPQSLVPVLPK